MNINLQASEIVKKIKEQKYRQTRISNASLEMARQEIQRRKQFLIVSPKVKENKAKF